MVLVSEVPFADLRIGDVVISATGKRGFITALEKEGPDRTQPRYDEVSMVFYNDDGTEVTPSSRAFHMNLDRVRYIGPESGSGS